MEPPHVGCYEVHGPARGEVPRFTDPGIFQLQAANPARRDQEFQFSPRARAEIRFLADSQTSFQSGFRRAAVSILRSNMATADEKVLVFPRSLLEQLGVFQGFSPEVNRYLPAILEKKNNSFMARAQAETNPAFKQVIPYVVITDGQSVLHYVRGKKAGEQRLVAKGSVGIGGHINNEDETLLSESFGLQAFQRCRETGSVRGAFHSGRTRRASGGADQ